ncbi:hypothetical protein JCM5350_000143 [Sporobolomyces pararoseus]
MSSPLSGTFSPSSHSSESESLQAIKPRNFAQLPSELMQHIFDYLLPFPIFPSFYKERQSLFRRLSLVNKQFKPLAQYYLLHVVKLSTAGEKSLSKVDSLLRKLRKSEMGSANKVRCLILEDLEPKHRLGLEGVKGLCEKLEEVSYRSKREEMASLLSFHCLLPFIGSNIKRLHLKNVTIPDLSDSVSFDFPLLEQLSFDNVVLPPEPHFFYNLPSLRHFHSASASVVAYFLKALLPQLHSFTALLDEYDALSKKIRQSTVPCLLRCSADGSWFGVAALQRNESDISHLRLEGNISYSDWFYDWVKALSNLRAPVNLRSLYVPVHYDSTLEGLENDKRQVLLELERVCQLKGIELIREDTGTDENDQSRLSQEFIRRVKAGRA